MSCAVPGPRPVAGARGVRGRALRRAWARVFSSLLTLLSVACEPPVPHDPSSPLIGYESRQDPLTWVFEVNDEAPAQVELSCAERACSDPVDCDLHSLALDTSTTRSFALGGLKAGAEYLCALYPQGSTEAVSTPILVATAPLPEDLVLPRIVVPSADPATTGYTLFASGLMLEGGNYLSNYLVLLDPFGHVRWYCGNCGDQDVGGGDVDVSFVPDSLLGQQHIVFGGQGEGPIVPTVVDLNKEVLFQAGQSTSVPDEKAGAYNHDAGISSTRDSLFTLVKLKHPAGEGEDSYLWEGFVVKEISLEDRSVLWTWDSMSQGVEKGLLPVGSATNPDPYHVNAVMDRWETGRRYVFISIKHLNTVWKIDYLTHEVVWRLGIGGDFTLLEPGGSLAADERWFFWQHDAQRVGSLLTVYDNGSTRNQYYNGPSYSRALELELDESAMTARIVWEYAGEAGFYDPDGDGLPNYGGTRPSWNEFVWGGFDHLPNGHRLLALAHCDACNENTTSALVEFGPGDSPEILWRAQFERPDLAIYRADHVDGCALFHNRRICPE